MEPLALDWGLAPLASSDYDGVGERLAEWVREERHGGMRWYPESVAVRADPWKEWPWTRSVLAVRWNYPLPRPQERGMEPVVAGYARVGEYHEYVSEALRAACRLLEDEFPGVRTRWFCDALPVQEVHLGVLCGLGWKGRNGLLIERSKGSAFHLGGILLSLDGVDVPPACPNHCGTCSACLDACPSRAIDPRGFVDASRCISQWSIEDRRTGESSGAAAEAVRGEIFGCDICQQACPWNRKVMTDSVYPSEWPRSWEEWKSPMLDWIDVRAIRRVDTRGSSSPFPARVSRAASTRPRSIARGAPRCCASCCARSGMSIEPGLFRSCDRSPSRKIDPRSAPGRKRELVEQAHHDATGSKDIAGSR